MKHLFYILFLSTALSSCSLYNYTYITTPLNNGDVKKKGELKVDAYIPITRFTAQASYAPTNKLAVLANYTTGFKGESHSFDFATGYYNDSHKFYYNIYGGIGISSVSLDEAVWGGFYISDYYYSNTQYNKAFIQSTIGKKIRRKINLSFAIRGSFVHFNSYSYKYKSANYKGKTYYDELELVAPANTIVLDPQFAFEFLVSKFISFQLQTGLVGALRIDSKLNDYEIDLTQYSNNSYYSTGNVIKKQTQPVFFPVTINLGARININTIKN